MVSEAHVWVDVEGAIRAWAREALPAVDGRVFFATNDDVSDPQIVVQRIAGTDDACLVQFDVWAEKKHVAADIAAALCTAIDALARFVADDGILHGAAVESITWQPDVESDMPRYIIQATFTASASASS